MGILKPLNDKHLNAISTRSQPFCSSPSFISGNIMIINNILRIRRYHMSWTPQKQAQQMVKSSTSRRLLINVCILTLAIAILGGTAVTYQVRAAHAAPLATGNILVDQDHGLQFSKNKQNEPAITRDPTTGVLIARANEQNEPPPFPGTTVPLARP